MIRIPARVYRGLGKLPLDGEEVWGIAGPSGIEVLGRIDGPIDVSELFKSDQRSILFIFHTHPAPAPPFPSGVDISTAKKLPLLYAIVGRLLGVGVVTFYSSLPFSIVDIRSVDSSPFGDVHIAVRPLNTLLRLLHPSFITRTGYSLLRRISGHQRH